MQALEKIRLNDEQLAILETGRRVAIPASWEEFEDFLADTDYRTEYYNGQIIIMGLATLIHEILVIRLGNLLTGFYAGKPFYIAGSNAGIRKDGRKGHYNGDVVVIKGQPVYQGESRSIITNPYLIVEVLSKSTSDYDLGAKRRKYEQIEALQEIVFVDPLEREIVVYRRTEQMNVWTETTYSQPDDQVKIDEYKVRLSDVFADLPIED